MAYSFDDAEQAERHPTQYFEMFCNRGIYHQGWTAVTRHSIPWVVGDLPPFDQDVWELYDTTTDWSQALSDTSGQWQSQLAYDGGVHAVRLDDGVHLTEDGSFRTSAWTTATLMQLWSRPQVESVV